MKREKSDSGGHSFQDYFKRATSHLVVLTILSEEPMYSYQLSGELEKRSENGYSMSFLYPLLYRLLELGYIRESNREPPRATACAIIMRSLQMAGIVL